MSVDPKTLAEADQKIATTRETVEFMASVFPALVEQHGHSLAVAVGVTNALDVFDPRQLAFIAIVAIDLLSRGEKAEVAK